jgi:hypothetical protein
MIRPAGSFAVGAFDLVSTGFTSKKDLCIQFVKKSGTDIPLKQNSFNVQF